MAERASLAMCLSPRSKKKSSWAQHQQGAGGRVAARLRHAFHVCYAWGFVSWLEILYSPCPLA